MQSRLSLAYIRILQRKGRRGDGQEDGGGRKFPWKLFFRVGPKWPIPFSFFF